MSEAKSDSTVLLSVLYAWRAAEVKHGSIIIGKHEGNPIDSEREHEAALVSLRIAADHYFRKHTEEKK